MFAKELKEIDEEISVSYPERTDLIREIAADLQNSYESLCGQGLKSDEARKEALRLFHFSNAEHQAMEVVHATLWQKIWLKMPKSWRSFMEICGCLIPFLAAILII